MLIVQHVFEVDWSAGNVEAEFIGYLFIGLDNMRSKQFAEVESIWSGLTPV